MPVLQASIGPWKPTTGEGGPQNLKAFTGIPAQWYANLQLHTQPFIVTAFSYNQPNVGYEWNATGVTVRIMMWLEVESVFGGSAVSLEAYATRIKNLEENISKIPGMITELMQIRTYLSEQQAKGDTTQLKVEQNQNNNSIKTLENEKRTWENEVAKVTTEREQYLIEGAVTISKESHGGSLGLALLFKLPNGRTIQTELKDPFYKQVGNILTKITTNVQGERGQVYTQYILEWNQTLQFVQPIEYSDNFQPRAEMIFTTSIQGKESPVFTAGNFIYGTEVVIQEMNLNYINRKAGR